TLRAARDPPDPHQAAPPLDQRPGRGLHRHDPTRVLLRRELLHQRGGARSCAVAVSRLLQRRAPPHRHRWSESRTLATRSRRDPSLWGLHLGPHLLPREALSIELDRAGPGLARLRVARRLVVL